MIIINPYYLILNVIFVDTRRKVVFIKREVWNETVRLLGMNRKRLDRLELQRLKKEIYNMYIIYMKRGSLDFDKFSKLIQELSGLPQEPIELAETSQTIRLVYDDSEYVTEESQPFLNEVENFENCSVIEASFQNINDLEIRSEFAKTLTSKIAAQIEYQENYSKMRHDLINFVGYGLLKSGFTQIFSNQKYIPKTFEEFLFYKLDIDFLSNLLFYNDECSKHNHIKIAYICNLCETINCHKNVDLTERHMVTYDVEAHKDQVVFFNKRGLINSDDLEFHKSSMVFKPLQYHLKNIDDVDELLLKYSVFQENLIKVKTLIDHKNSLNHQNGGFTFLKMDDEIRSCILEHQVLVKLNNDEKYYLDFNITFAGMEFNQKDGYTFEEFEKQKRESINSLSSQTSSLSSIFSITNDFSTGSSSIFSNEENFFGSSQMKESHKRNNTRINFKDL